jgi:hypothetical protein
VTSASSTSSHWRMYRTLYLLIIVCVAPVVASYLAYYVLPPSGRTNYGELIEPQMPLPSVDARLQDGAAFDLTTLRGHWVMLQVDSSACDEACRNKLWQMRQLRTAQGKDADRIERVFLVTDGEPLQTMLMREFDGTHFLRVSRDELRFMPTPDEPAARIEDHIYMIDPLGNLMMRWPRAADPNRMKRDIGRLLKASRVG